MLDGIAGWSCWVGGIHPPITQMAQMLDGTAGWYLWLPEYLWERRRCCSVEQLL